MTQTVDLVVDGGDLGCGDGRAVNGGSVACAAATDALQRGGCVLVVLRSGDTQVARRVRRCLCRAANVDVRGVIVMTNAKVVCVDGVVGVEAVVVRYTRTGRLCAVNTRAFLSCDGERTERLAMRPANRSRERSQCLPTVDGPVRPRDPGGHGMATS